MSDAMTIDAPVELLDHHDGDAVAAYERVFYDTFARVTGNQLIRWLWQWDDAAGRLATRIPYEDQLVYLQRDCTGAIDAAIAVNTGLSSLQSASYGFALPPGNGLCEFLVFFAHAEHNLRTRFAFWSACFADLRRRGLHTGYATTARRPLTFYRRIGGIVEETAMIENEERFFLRFSLDRDYIRGRDMAAPVPHHGNMSRLDPVL